VQPFVALAVGLQQRGHAVRLAAPHRFEGFVRQHAVEFTPLAGEPEVLSRILNDAGSDVGRIVRGMRAYVLSIAPEVVKAARQSLVGAELVVHSFLFTTGAHSYARELGIPDVSVQLFPVFAPTRAFANVAVERRLPGWMNYFSHWLGTQVFWHGGNAGYRQLRRGAPADFPQRLYWPFSPEQCAPTPRIFAYSPAVVPRPNDWQDPGIAITGYFFLDKSNAPPDAALDEFIGSGPAPVCVSFGSTLNRDTQKVMQEAMTALKRDGSRAIFLTGWGGWQPDVHDKQFFFVDSASHNWLFPRCKLIVHHGGAGTTGAGLRSGKPNLVIPHASDQPFWGNRVAEIGAGPIPIHVRAFSAERFLAGLEQAQSDAIREKADSIGRTIRAEDGVGRAIEIIERHAAEFRSKAS